MTEEKSKKILEEKKSVEIEFSVSIKQDREYKGTFNPIYMKMIDEGLV
jgi:hypothetical protein